MHWDVPVELSPAEKKVVERLKKRGGKFYVFLRLVRHRLFDPAFEATMSLAYKPRGQQPLPPALLAMVTLLQAYDQVGDRDAVATVEMDMRWQLVLGTLGLEDAPFGQGSLTRFRERMVAHELDKRLLERTIELAKETGLFGWRNLKAALDSSPLLGAGRVEDSWNLIGRAMSKVVEVVGRVTEVEPTQIIAEAGLSALTGSSLKAAFDIDWDDPKQRHDALQLLLEQAERLAAWVQRNAESEAERPPLSEAVEDLQRVIAQDLEPNPDGGGKRIRRGVAKDRMPSLGDREMRHGRKSKRKPFTGYKRHIAQILGEANLIVGAEVRAANQAEHATAPALLDAAGEHGLVQELHIDRAYLASEVVSKLVEQGRQVHCKPFPLHNRGLFTKEAFGVDLDRSTVTCPAGEQTTIPPNRRARFSATTCNSCPLKLQCTSSQRGRTITVHRLEKLLQRLRKNKKTTAGRKKLRERVAVEHGLAAVSRIQGHRARYRGERKNALDLRRCAAVVNLQTLARLQDAA